MRCEHCNRYARHLTPQLLPGGFGLVLKDACADRSCDDTPLGVQTRATALVRRQEAIQAHHGREEVLVWRESHAGRQERERSTPMAWPMPEDRPWPDYPHKPHLPPEWPE